MGDPVVEAVEGKAGDKGRLETFSFEVLLGTFSAEGSCFVDVSETSKREAH